MVMVSTSPAGAVACIDAKYCNEYVCVCVCVSARADPEGVARRANAGAWEEAS